MSFAPEVIADSSKKWCGNALRFATKEEAEANVQDLKSRWLMVIETRVVESKDPVNYCWDPEKGLVAVKPKYYHCGICECHHPLEWNGDCRDDANRFATDQLDAKHGALGWEEVEQPS